MKTHRWKPLVKQCDECNERAVKWRCKDCEDDFCSKCFKQFHRRGNRRSHGYHSLPYLSTELHKREIKLAAEIAANDAQEKMLLYQKQQAFEKQVFVAVKLQSIWRGKQDRVIVNKLLKQDRLKQRAYWRQNKADDKERGKLTTKLKSILGNAPVFETDDELVKKEKRQGWKGTVWGKAAVKIGAIVPYGEELPGMVVIYANTNLNIDTTADWSELVHVHDYIRIQNEEFKILGIKNNEKKTLLEMDVTFREPIEKATTFQAFYLGQLSALQEKTVLSKRSMQQMKNSVQEKVAEKMTEYDVRAKVANMAAISKDIFREKKEELVSNNAVFRALNTKLNGSKMDLFEEDDWQVFYDETYQANYYYNETTGETTWINPV